MSLELTELQKLLLEMEQRIGRRQDEFRTELVTELREIKADLKTQAISLARVETRLDEGDKRMTAIEDRNLRLEARIQQLEDRERKSSLLVAKLAGLSAAAGAVGGGAARFLGL